MALDQAIDPATLARRQSAVVEQIRPILAGHGAAVQGAVLADLVAMWMAGHVVVGATDDTEQFRDEMLAVFVETVRSLVEPNAKMIGADLVASEIRKHE